MRWLGSLYRITHRTTYLICLISVWFSVTAAEPGKVSAWEVRKGDSTVYLVGSIHSLRESDYPLPFLFEQIANNSSQIVFELLQEDLNSSSTAQLVQQLGVYPLGAGIYDDISRETYALLQAYLLQNNLPRDYFDRSRPWLASGEIDNREATKAGFKSELGIEQYFYRFAIAQQKTIRALETAEFQIRLFAETPISDQEVQLRAGVTNAKSNVQQLIEMAGYWKSGNLEAMRQLINAAEDPVSYARFFTDRNRGWVTQIEAFLEQSETSLVIAGVGHFAGSDSVIEMLQQRGYRIEQLPIDPPSIDQITVTDQGVLLRIKAAATRKLTIYSSSDLVVWEPQGTIDHPNSVTEFTAARSSGARFYRAALSGD